MKLGANTRARAGAANPWVFILVIFGGLALVFTYRSYQQAADERSNLVSVHFERPSALAGAISDMELYVNGIKLGKVGNGGEAQFSFVPRRTGQNTAYCELVVMVGPNIRSAEVPFVATPGAVLQMRGIVDTWVVTSWQAQLSLSVVTKSEGKPLPPEYYVQGQPTQDSKTPAANEASIIPAVNPKSGTPAQPGQVSSNSAFGLNEIAAIASVGSFVIALVAFIWKPSLFHKPGS